MWLAKRSSLLGVLAGELLSASVQGFVLRPLHKPMPTIRTCARDDDATDQEWHEKLKERFDRIQGNCYDLGKMPTLLGDLPTIAIGSGGSTVPFPVQQTVADWIKGSGAATKAPFGKGEETVVDERVRKTWQLEPESVSFVDDDTWNETVEKIKVEAVNHLIGEPEFGQPVANVKAKLHKLLLYEEGDFFKPHADSEKEPGMFATLSIQLPSCFTGGAMQIRHRGSTHEIALAPDCKSTIQWVAWFADCIHEFQPIESGCRFVLVYNLIRAVDDNSGNRQVVEDKKMLGTPGIDAIMDQWKRSIEGHQTGGRNNKDQQTDEELNARYYVHKLDHRYCLSAISKEPYPETFDDDGGYRVSREPQLSIGNGGRDWLQCLKGRDCAVALECLASSDVVETSFLLTDFEYDDDKEDVRSYQAVYGEAAKEVSLYPRHVWSSRILLTADRGSLERVSTFEFEHLLAYQHEMHLGNEGQLPYYFYRSAYLLLRHLHGDTAAGADE